MPHGPIYRTIKNPISVPGTAARSPVCSPLLDISISFSRMELKEDQSSSNPKNGTREIFTSFLAEVVKFEELVGVGRRFLFSFQQALEFLRRPSIHETSELVQSTLKAKEINSVLSYVQAGCANVDDSKQNIFQMITSFSGLQDHLAKAKGVIDQLKNLMDKIQLEMEFSEVRQQEDVGSDAEEVTASESFDAAVCASFMAIIYSMVKQDYLMQEKIVSSLSIKTSAAELVSYCQMWSLRPYVNDDIIHQALRHVQ